MVLISDSSTVSEFVSFFFDATAQASARFARRVISDTLTVGIGIFSIESPVNSMTEPFTLLRPRSQYSIAFELTIARRLSKGQIAELPCTRYVSVPEKNSPSASANDRRLGLYDVTSFLPLRNRLSLRGHKIAYHLDVFERTI